MMDVFGDSRLGSYGYDIAFDERGVGVRDEDVVGGGVVLAKGRVSSRSNLSCVFRQWSSRSVRTDLSYVIVPLVMWYSYFHGLHHLAGGDDHTSQVASPRQCARHKTHVCASCRTYGSNGIRA